MISKKPTISVIMSTYNSSSTVVNSVKSVLTQTYKDFELLIVDDCSTDDTYSVLQNLCSNYQNITLLRNNKNLGLTKSLNKLIHKARGQIIARQDDDDISHKDRFELQFNFIKKYNLDFSTTRAITKPNNRVRPGLSMYFPKKILINYKNPFVHGTLMIKKNVLIEIGLYNEKFYYAQDYKLMYDLIKNNYKFKVLNKKLYILNTLNNLSTHKKEEQEYYARFVKKNTDPELRI